MDKITFRFDDVCINANMELHNCMTDYLFEKFPNCEVIWAVSPLVFDYCGERVYPKQWNAKSDHTVFYHMKKTGTPFFPSANIVRASHGLFHVDHRLLNYEAQEMSIVASCSLVNANVFVPPFNKYNKDTIAVCEKHGIELIYWEDGWDSMEHNKYRQEHRLWYLHAREWTFESFKAWFE